MTTANSLRFGSSFPNPRLLEGICGSVPEMEIIQCSDAGCNTHFIPAPPHWQFARTSHNCDNAIGWLAQTSDNLKPDRTSLGYRVPTLHWLAAFHCSPNHSRRKH